VRVSAGDPPSGVVTFLFTDIEGSTRRWEADAEALSDMRCVGMFPKHRDESGVDFNHLNTESGNSLRCLSGRLRPYYRQLGARVTQVVFDLPRFVQRVHRHNNGAAAQYRVVENGKCVYVGNHDSDPVAGPDAYIREPRCGSCHFSVQLSVGEQHIPLPKGDSMRIRAGGHLKVVREIGHAVLQYSLIARSSGC
jgi:hypothetical protein